MQRVLSMQTARGFGESSEFVTKRSCISFLFSIGFLCLLGGFLLGRFATHRNIMVRAERNKLQFANNGLEITEHLQHRIFEILKDANFIANISKNTFMNEIFSELKLIDHVFEYKSCKVAKIQGSRESDRYIVVSSIEKKFQILNELLKSLNKIHEEQEWNPRRTILFCVCQNDSKDCFNELPDYIQSKIVAFLTMPDNIEEGSYNLLSAEEACFLVSGSNIVKTAVQQVSDSMSNFNSKPFNICNERQFISVSRHDSNAPQAVFSFVNDKNSSLNGIMDDKILAQVIGLSVWRLSESIILPWNSTNLRETIFQNLMNVESSRHSGSHENREMTENLNNLMENVTIYDEKLDSMETTNSLNIRIANDLLLDLDKTILCLNNQQLQSSSRIKECYKNVIGILQA